MSALPPVRTLADHLTTPEDPRVERTRLHPLLSIVAIAICAVIIGVESSDKIAEAIQYRPRGRG